MSDTLERTTDAPPRRTLRLALGALAGIVAALAGLAAAELVAALGSTTLQSPVVDVADRVVDGVPRRVKELAIDWFGTNDKTALLAGIASILTVYAAVVGVLALGRRPWLAGVGIGLFGLAGVYASQSTRRDAPWTAAIPSIAGALAAGLALWVLRRAVVVRPTSAAAPATPISTGHRPSIAELTPSDRRRFLATAGLAGAGALVVGATARRVAARESAAASRASVVLPRADRVLPAPAAGVRSGVPGTVPFFTPNADFYRIDTAITVPQVRVDDWELRVTGMVGRPLSVTFDDLLRRELVEADITLTCVSNEVGGKLLGTARWLGVRLDDLLDEARPDRDADQIVGRSVDGYTCGFPFAALDGRDALVAIGMNGEPLPLRHGFPARLIVPGLYGYVSATKWLREIELTTFDRFDQYWVQRGWVDDAPVKLQSRIDTPRGLATLPPGRTAIAGVAWAQTRGIERVEVRIDEGEWLEATLAGELTVDTWRQWSYPWDATPGRHSIEVRAAEHGGAIQTAERSEPFPSGATGHHQIVVIVR